MLNPVMLNPDVLDPDPEQLHPLPMLAASSDSLYSTFELQQPAGRDCGTITSATAATAAAIGPGGGLRHRTVGSKGEAPRGAEEEESSSAASAFNNRGPVGEEDSGSSRSASAPEGDSIKARAPLSWFGVLIPPTLREAQASFRQGE